MESPIGGTETLEQHVGESQVNLDIDKVEQPLGESSVDNTTTVKQPVEESPIARLAKEFEEAKDNTNDNRNKNAWIYIILVSTTMLVTSISVLTYSSRRVETKALDSCGSLEFDPDIQICCKGGIQLGIY